MQVSIMCVTISGVTGRGTECPLMFSTGNFFADLRGKERQGKMEKKRRKIAKGKLEGEKSMKMSRKLTFFFLHVETTEICCGCTKIEISTRKKKTFHAGKKIKKSDFATPEKYSSYATGHHLAFREGVWGRMCLFSFCCYSWFATG